jgi:hypothetical protein
MFVWQCSSIRYIDHKPSIHQRESNVKTLFKIFSLITKNRYMTLDLESEFFAYFLFYKWSRTETLRPKVNRQEGSRLPGVRSEVTREDPLEAGVAAGVPGAE